MSRVKFHVPGKPTPNARPRVTRHGTYEPKSTKEAKALVVFAWQGAGGLSLEAEDVAVDVLVVVPRPKSHLKKSGDLSAAGLAAPSHPRGDVDNYLKLVMDALNGLAWADDAQIVQASVMKAWEHYAVPPGLYVEAWLKPPVAHRMDVDTVAGRHELAEAA